MNPLGSKWSRPWQEEQYPSLEIVEPRENRITREHRIVSFENIWDLMRGSQRIGLGKIQEEINYLRMKGVDIDDVFLVLVEIMKKVMSGVAWLTWIRIEELD